MTLMAALYTCKYIIIAFGTQSQRCKSPDTYDQMLMTAQTFVQDRSLYVLPAAAASSDVMNAFSLGCSDMHIT